MSASITIARDLAALDPLFSFLDERFRSHAVDEDTAFCVKLAAEELFTNLVRHNRGGAGDVDVEFDCDDRRVELRLVDRDVDPAEPSSFPTYDADSPLAERDASGLGLHLVRSVVDRLAYEYDDRTMTVIATKRL